MWNEEDETDGVDDEYDPEKERRRVEALPIFQKAEEIGELTQRIVDSIEKDDVKLIHGNFMLEDAMMITVKIVGAEAVDDFIIKMENATLIKIHARSLQTKTASLLLQGVMPAEYLQLLRKEIDNFRLLFLEWIKTFHQSSKENDGWGLFLE